MDQSATKARFYSSRADKIQLKLSHCRPTSSQKKTPDQSGGKGEIRGKWCSTEESSSATRLGNIGVRRLRLVYRY